MLVKPSEVTKREVCIALFNRYLHSHSYCPANHEVDYAYGWFRFDDKVLRRPDLTAEADVILKSHKDAIWFSESFNTYLLADY